MTFAHVVQAIGFIPTKMAPFRTMSAGIAYRFGPFELDSGRRRLVRGRDPVWLPDRHMDVLLLLLAQAGRIVSKDDLVEAAWHGLAVTDNSIVQAVRGLRITLGNQPDGESYIETSVRKGYRFAAPVEQVTRQPTRVPLEGLLEPYRAFRGSCGACNVRSGERQPGARDTRRGSETRAGLRGRARRPGERVSGVVRIDSGRSRTGTRPACSGGLPCTRGLSACALVWRRLEHARLRAVPSRRRGRSHRCRPEVCRAGARQLAPSSAPSLCELGRGAASRRTKRARSRPGTGLGPLAGGDCVHRSRDFRCCARRAARRVRCSGCPT